MKDEGKIGKKMKETMLVEGKLIVLDKVRLYVQSMAKGDLEVKRVEPKSNQSPPLAAAMAIAPAVLKLAWWWRKIVEDSKAIEKKESGLLNRKGSDTMRMFD